MRKIGTGKSDIGKVRTNNEDSFFVCNEGIGKLPNLYVVADGMGGHNAGEVASAKSIEFFKEYILACEEDLTIEEILLRGSCYANKNVFELSIANLSQTGMGTTFTACVIEDGKLYFAHVGDSRLYLISKEEIKQVTEDHTFVNEMYKSGEFTKAQAQNHPKRNMLTRALGTEEDTGIDVGCEKIEPEQFVLICSDGLSNMLSEEVVLRIVSDDADNSAKVSMLIDAANEGGGFDNISVIVI